MFCAQVKGVMRQNIERVAQRGEKLEDLGERAGESQMTACIGMGYVNFQPGSIVCCALGVFLQLHVLVSVQKCWQENCILPQINLCMTLLFYIVPRYCVASCAEENMHCSYPSQRTCLMMPTTSNVQL